MRKNIQHSTRNIQLSRKDEEEYPTLNKEYPMLKEAIIS
jgi:hypothetical protein